MKRIINKLKTTVVGLYKSYNESNEAYIKAMADYYGFNYNKNSNQNKGN